MRDHRVLLVKLASDARSKHTYFSLLQRHTTYALRIPYMMVCNLCCRWKYPVLSSSLTSAMVMKLNSLHVRWYKLYPYLRFQEVWWILIKFWRDRCIVMLWGWYIEVWPGVTPLSRDPHIGMQLRHGHQVLVWRSKGVSNAAWDTYSCPIYVSVAT